MALYLVGYWVPIIMAAVALPMVLGKVPPNRIYGFRTPKTLSSPNIWYPANRIAGWLMIAAGGLVFCHNLALLSKHPDWPWERLLTFLAVGDLIALLLASFVSLLYLRKL